MSAQFLFFSGKGGVGKTSLACATAVQAADAGTRTLLVTTDPASNLADVFEQPIGHRITPIALVPNLWAMEIDPDQATAEYKEHALGPLRDIFPAAMVQVLEEQMSGPCTAEVAAFDRFVDFLEPASDLSATVAPGDFDLVIFDTAPTGHTIRLIELPAEWSRTIAAAGAGSGQTCIGPAAAIQDARQKYDRALTTMRDPARTTFIFVLHPEATAIQETRRAIDELARLGIHTHQLVVNGLIPASEAVNPLFAPRMALQAGYLAQIARDFPLPTRHMALLHSEIKGVDRLRDVAQVLQDAPPAVPEVPFGGAGGVDMPAPCGVLPPSHDLDDMLARLEPGAQPRALFFAGKGGVGKTVVSCLTAVWLARRGYKTLLLTTDPAAHIGDVLGVPVGDEIRPVPGLPNLWATRIDPKAAGAAYKARILADARQRGRPEAAIRVMAEELDSPCTDEMAAFDKFIEYASAADWQVTVFDTAPTGHTLRLLELPVDWSKQLDVKVFASVDSVVADDVAKQRFGQVIARMTDPAQSTFAFVMYPEATPILEAARAAEELRTIGIVPGLAVANFVLPGAGCNTPFSRARWTMQQGYLAEMTTRFPVPLVQIPLLPYDVAGLARLAALGEQIYGPAHAEAAFAAPVPAGRA